MIRKLLVVYAAGVIACGDDVALGTGMIASTGEGDDATTSGAPGSSDDGADESGGAGGEGGGAPGMPCDFEEDLDDAYLFVATPSSAGPDRFQLEPDLDCVFPGILDAPAGLDETDDFSLWVYHPQNAAGTDWPADHPPFPVVFFVPGRGLNLVGGVTHTYLPLMRSLVEAGFVVIGIQPDASQWAVRERRGALACAMIFARDEPTIASHISNVVTIAGHSQGGSAAMLLTRDLLLNFGLPSGTSLDEWDQCAAVTIAQSYAEELNPLFSTNTPIEDSTAPPLLALHGAVDEDTTTQQIAGYDNWYSETFIDAVTSEPDLNDQVLLQAYGYGHNTWGGTMSGGDSLISPFYVPEFLRWQILGETGRRASFVDVAAWDADVGSFPAAIVNAPLWSTPDLELYFVGCGGPGQPNCPAGQGALAGLQRPLVHIDYTQGVAWGGATRLALDTFEGLPSEVRCENFDFSPDLLDSTLGGAVTVEALQDPDEAVPCVCTGPLSDLTDGVNDPALTCAQFLDDGEGGFLPVPFGASGHDSHDTNAMLVQWGGGFGDAVVRFSLEDEDGFLLAPNQIGGSTHLSFRLANLLTDHDAMCDDALDEFTISVELRHDDLLPGDPGPTITVHPLIDPQERLVAVTQQDDACFGAQLMHTVRIPLPDFCVQGGMSVNELTEVVFRFEDDNAFHVAALDSIEFTHDPFVDGENGNFGECGQDAGGFACVASSALVASATETSCAGEPINGSCPGASERYTVVSLPIVDAGANPQYSGWVVDAPAGYVANLASPTSAELDQVQDLCVEACELEFSDQPNVSVACSAPAAFVPPTLVSTSDVGSAHRIPDSYRYGNGLFAGVPLIPCDLEAGCCSSFDEQLCATSPQRTTAASQPLRRGEEWRVSLGNDSRVRFATATGSVVAKLEGEAGFSLCPDGSGAACPFYVGSLEASAIESATLIDVCPDGSTFSANVTDFDIELVQPIYGVADVATDAKAFPPGAVHTRAFFTINGDSFTVRAVNELAIYFEASDADLFTGDIDLDVTVPCGIGTIDVTASIIFEAKIVLEGPPTIEITTPPLIACDGSNVALAASVSDPDGDLAEVRWYVDDVLMGASVSSIPMNSGHLLRAVAFDARGAATTDVLTLACL